MVDRSALLGSPETSDAIIYSLVARGKVVLAEYTSQTGNFPTVTRFLLQKIPDDRDGRMSYQYDEHIFHYICRDGVTYMCMTAKDALRRMPFLFLDDVADLFCAQFGERAYTAIAFELNDAFSPVLAERMRFYAENPDADNIGRVNRKIDDVKNVMLENIEKILERGEKIELLVDKTENLNQQAFKFERSATTLKRTMVCKKIRCYIFVTIVVLVFVFFVGAYACGGITFEKCRGGKGKH